MALSKYTLIADGTTNIFPVQFELGFISRDHVTVRVNEEIDGSSDPLYRTLTWIDDGNVSIGATPANGDTVNFTRTVPSDVLIHDYSNGAPIIESNLDDSNLQTIHLFHQLLDGRLSDSITGDLNMGTLYTILNLRTPSASGDAVNKGYVDALISASQTNATNAAASELAASLYATTASNAATAADVSETNAASSETNAAASETAAGVSETNAAASAASASADATTASTQAGIAGGHASDASTDAATATSKASEASGYASAAAASAIAVEDAKIIWRGEYDAGTAYSVNDAVSYSGSSYVNTAASTGVVPTNVSNWDVLASAGGSGDFVLLSTWVPTAVNNYKFVFDSSLYSAVKIAVDSVAPASTFRRLRAQIGHTGGTVMMTADEYYNQETGGDLPYIDLCSATTKGTSVDLDIFGLQSTTHNPGIRHVGTWINGTTDEDYTAAVRTLSLRNSGSRSFKMDAVDVYWDSGNYQAGVGTIRLYGLIA